MATELSVWPVTAVSDAVDALARHAGLAAPDPARRAVLYDGDLPAALLDAAERVGLGVRQWDLAAGDAGRWLSAGPHCVLRTPDGLLVLVGGGSERIIGLGPDLRRRPLAVADVLSAVGRSPAVARSSGLGEALARAGLDPASAERIARAVARSEDGARAALTAWTLTRAPGLVRGRVWIRPALLVATLAVAEAACLVLAWWLLGRETLRGHVDPGWLAAFLLLLATAVPLQVFGRVAQGALAFGAGAALQARLFLGALRLRPEETAGEGTGRMLARVFESVRVQWSGLGAAFAALTGAVQLPFAFFALAHGAAPAGTVLLLGGATAATAALAARFYRRQKKWTRLRARHTETLVELMLGHRTRQAQELPSRRHGAEDAELAALVSAAQVMDDSAAPLLAVVPRAFFVAALVVQAAAILEGAAPTAIAVGVGGILLGQGALALLGHGARQAGTAALSWSLVRDLSEAAGRRPRPASPTLPALAAGADPARPVIDGRALGYGYPGRPGAAVAEASFAIARGERVLIEGPSGAGKSTLAALLGGLRTATTGALRLKGIESRAWGEARWRRQVVLAPQFHQNHLFAATLAWNLLLGRGWPPSEEDLAAARAVCDELGLGPLVDRMPAGLLQPVGETGWQLSHGERTRVFLARALLQPAEVVVLDESFAALDPHTLRIALESARRRAATLLVIAHP
jgi:ATP-binding cassette subfamily B protein